MKQRRGVSITLFKIDNSKCLFLENEETVNCTDVFSPCDTGTVNIITQSNFYQTGFLCSLPMARPLQTESLKTDRQTMYMCYSSIIILVICVA